jgi:hypothetical protein
VKQRLNVFEVCTPRNNQRPGLLANKDIWRVSDLVRVISKGNQQNREQEEKNQFLRWSHDQIKLALKYKLVHWRFSGYFIKCRPVSNLNFQNEILVQNAGRAVENSPDQS